ncbi:MAG TPA: TylF/MycF/NovP-related O-methyltransferase [Verrucomicrobiae bacterium]|nr:TylF/MycF/NovP-related O-methyltransferase [Verrucomicrobiae bacterium]
MLKKLIQWSARTCGYEIKKVPAPASAPSIPDGELYQPLFSPWLGGGDFRRYYMLAAPKTLVTPDRCFVLYTLLRQAMSVPGDVWECGVYKGGTAAMMAAMLNHYAPEKRLHLFDTFEGMPATDPIKDIHQKGDFSDTSLEAVSKHVSFAGQCIFHKGFIPDTFQGLERAEIAFAHIDVDIYKSIIDCLAFIWPRLSNGGFIIFDDYGFPTCPGARTAVDTFFKDKTAFPLCLPTGQALVFKSR